MSAPGTTPHDLCGDAGAPQPRAAPSPLPRFAIETADFNRGKVVLKGKYPIRDGRELHRLLHLLDAAPDLLEALKDLVQLEGGRLGTGVIKPGTYGEAVMNAARDAIAKATRGAGSLQKPAQGASNASTGRTP